MTSTTSCWSGADQLSEVVGGQIRRQHLVGLRWSDPHYLLDTAWSMAQQPFADFFLVQILECETMAHTQTPSNTELSAFRCCRVSHKPTRTILICVLQNLNQTCNEQKHQEQESGSENNQFKHRRTENGASSSFEPLKRRNKKKVFFN